jgi:branched-subunit amino acid ABC-type transport system permease component
MRKTALEFVRRGLVAGGFGPVILAVLYIILERSGEIVSLTASQVCTGIFSLYALAFIAGGMNVVYQIERLPLMAAISIHGGVLYIGYLITYLVNGWLELGKAPIMVFTAIFIAGYLVIWAVIYHITRRNTRRLNEMLKQKQRMER